ncbi:hypothetical protein ACFFJ7_03035 [Pseudochelatococcus lubricantis]|uniref:hypothetical protein n=1 Tax=Pseudochelatococcus lubricantis TaxID=1538102 RepID=UPI0035EBAFE1
MGDARRTLRHFCFPGRLECFQRFCFYCAFGGQGRVSVPSGGAWQDIGRGRMCMLIVYAEWRIHRRVRRTV